MSVPLKEHLNLETACAPWHELQRFFAAGQTLYVSQKLSLLDVAVVIAEDNAGQLKQWVDEGTVGAVPDDMALAWFESDATVWTVVVRPWVLVQGAESH